MRNSIHTLKEISADRRTPLAHTVDPFGDRTAEILHQIDRCKSGDREVKADCDLFRVGEKGNAIYTLIDGWIALYNLHENGRKQILQFALPGMVIAFVPERNALMQYSAQALTDAVVCIISHETLGHLCRDNPEFGLQIAGLISRDRSLAYDHLSNIGRCSARERVAHLLLELFIRHRARWPGHHIEEMHLPLTQEHIGDATGLTNVHVNRVLRDLRKEGIIEFHYRRLRIMNPDKLVDVAGIDPHVALSWLKADSFNESMVHQQRKNYPTASLRFDAIRRHGSARQEMSAA